MAVDWGPGMSYPLILSREVDQTASLAKDISANRVSASASSCGHRSSAQCSFAALQCVIFWAFTERVIGLPFLKMREERRSAIPPCGS